jgi:hypothetical protein
MVDDKDVWRSAQILVKRYGETAGFEAAKRVDAMLEEGDPDGAAAWKRILKAVDELQAKERPAGATTH